MKFFFKILMIFIVAFCCSIVPSILALTYWNSMWLLCYIPLVIGATYIGIKLYGDGKEDQ